MGKVRKVNTETAEVNKADIPAEATPVEKKPAPRMKANANIVYRSLRELTAEDKLANQARIIAATVRELGPNGEDVSRVALCDALAKNENFKTRQPVERIVSYYQAQLKAMGLVEHARVPAQAAAEETPPAAE